MLIHGPSYGYLVVSVVGHGLGDGRLGSQCGCDGDAFAVGRLFYRRDFRFDFVAGYKCKQQGCDSKYFLHCLVLL